jgi:hypothetical protein
MFTGSAGTDLVPHSGDEHQARSHGTLEDSQENSCRDKSSPILCSRCADDNYTPLDEIRWSASCGRHDFASPCEDLNRTYKGNHRSEILRRRQYLHSVSVRKLAAQIANVEDHSQQAELRSGDTRIVLQTHNVGIIDESLV